MTRTVDEDDAGSPGPGAGRREAWAEGSVDDWLKTLTDAGGIGELLRVPRDEQLARGYGHTLREIGQQPVTWPETVATMIGRAAELERSLSGVGSLVLTGSGSSYYAAQCAAPCLQRRLRRPVAALPTGRILTHPEMCLPPSGPYLVVSLARSGNSPESRGAVDWLLEHQPQARHLAITCNRKGALATAYGDRENVQSIVLDEKTDDKSLVMTSSFTNLVLGARMLGAFGDPAACTARTRNLARAAAAVLRDRADALATASGEGRSVVYLGSGCRLGSAREAGLKMLEMTAGEVGTQAESYLGLRHGPMSALRRDTVVVAFLSSDPVVRAYEVDLLRELERKDLGTTRVVVGAEVPPPLGARETDVVVDCGPTADFADDDLTLIDTLVGQLLGFFRCRAAGYRPDSPSAGGVITRVVSEFEIHHHGGAR
jgi:tagatose-6-phosphate ketose/aldose isomerase